MFYSILGKEKCEDSEKISIFTDFNLNVCISYMNNLVKGYDLQKLYENIPKESETTKYRRKITSDMQNEEVFKAFDRYAKQVARAVSYEKKSTYSNLIYQKQKWHLDSLLIYIQAVEQLLDDLKRQLSYSDAMEELVSYLCEVTKSEAFVKGKELAQNLHQSMEETKMIFSLQKNKVVWEDKSEGKFFAERMAKAFAVNKKPGQAVNVNKETELTLLEKNLAERQIKRQNWDGMLETLLQIPMDEKLVQLAEDVQYYLGFFLLVRDMKGRGYSFCMPEETDKLEVEFLQKPNADTTQENLLDRLEDQIFNLSMVANISDENFGNSSGTALAYKLLSMDNLCRMKARKFVSGMNQRWKILATHPLSGIPEDLWTKLDYQFTRNTPKNLLEEVQAAAQMAGITSQRTQLRVISAVDNVDKELERIQEEQGKEPQDDLRQERTVTEPNDVLGGTQETP